MMNKQGPNKIDWTDYTWNPISGCLHNCPYCYMLRMEKRFPGIMKPSFRRDYLRDPERIKKPSKIFVGSSGDMWGAWVPTSWIEIVLDVVRLNPQHTFQFLTKNPSRYGDFHDLPENAWYGTTMDGREPTYGNDRVLKESVVDRTKFISFEPLINFPYADLNGLDWIIIGANSNRGAKKPPMKWAADLMYRAWGKGISVWIKNNYQIPEKIKEFPSWNQKTQNNASRG